jgi:hypothetical protein
VRAGVSCLKIEGRLKDASYVAATTRAWVGSWIPKILQYQCHIILIPLTVHMQIQLSTSHWCCMEESSRRTMCRGFNERAIVIIPRWACVTVRSHSCICTRARWK